MRRWQVAIVRANYIRRGSDPRTAAKKAGKAAKYYTEREGPDIAQRRWYAGDGRNGAFADFRKEISAQARAHPYIYRLVLSTKEADIGPAGYKEVLGNRFTQYYFIEHHNTDFPHAHVLGYTATRLSKAELTEIRGRVMEQEQMRARTQEQARGHQSHREKMPALERG